MSLVLSCLFTLVVATFGATSNPTIWPVPQMFTNGTTTLTVCSSNFNFSTNSQSAILKNAITRFNNYLMKPAPVLPTINPGKAYAASLCAGSITVSSSSESLSFETDENYTLSVDSTSIKITANTIYGAMYGLTTLTQLIRYASDSNVIMNAPWSITDYPHYKHRGVMLDPARNFLSVDMIKRVINGMALNKLNVLHLHLIDAQSFPFYSKSHPELSAAGAYSKEKIYQPSNLTDIVSYAKNMGVRVIPEFDTPGHTFAIKFGDPQIMDCVEVSDSVPAMCPEPPCGYLNVSNPNAYNTIMDIYADAWDIFDDTYFHIGADEVKDACWGKNTNQLYTQWLSQMAQDVNLKGKRTPILWSGDVDITAQIGQGSFDIIMQIWDNAADKLTALKNGFKVIDSTYTSYYLDCGFGNWLTGGNSWCDPYKSWMMIYNHSLTDGIPQQYFKDIIGGEVCLWGESVDDYNLQPRLWPRASAAAERWWSDLPLGTGSKLDDKFYRIAMQRDWMVYQGIVASPSQPEFCTLYPAYCNYYRDDILNNPPPADWKMKLKDYNLHDFIDAFEEHGWDMIELWNDISFEHASQMGMKQGHWAKFKHLLKEI
mmetsp:Transcript_29940/g.26469  ORF Transcript_29940/g.26469 Transcript_29940/m.26469 type:complete len:598 (+) Transcript_29940:76-1869(+)